MTLARYMAEAVHHLHRNHVIHRDIALRNFVVSRKNKPVLIDFGLARVFDDVRLWFFILA